MINILAISGSLRKTSSNTSLLRAAAQLTPPNVKIHLFEGLGSLPLFNPDLEGSEPQTVLDFRRLLKTSNAVLIASPEYAHGLSGSLKNALDWVVGSGEFVGKPVGLINASGRAVHAQESLHEIIQTMDAFIVKDASLTIPLPSDRIDARGILANPMLSGKLLLVIAAIVAAASRQHESHGALL